MDIRTDSVNDILCHYGITPGTGRDEGLQNARNKLFYDRDLLKDTVIYKITM